ESLFQHARELMAQRDLAQACVKFAESNRLAPKVGTLLNLAFCHEQQGKTASAWAEFTQGLAQARQKHQSDREDFAARHLEALRGTLSRIAITWDDPAPDEKVRLDGVELGTAAIGTELAVDPGEHAVEATAPGRQPWQGNVKVEVPGLQTVRVPRLGQEA